MQDMLTDSGIECFVLFAHTHAHTHTHTHTYTILLVIFHVDLWCWSNRFFTSSEL